ncbi:MAG: methyltransferase, partial [Alphaproteobacteria bacterium]|nr:methyltransferase [Alphaproteobacteria bacterium]
MAYRRARSFAKTGLTAAAFLAGLVAASSAVWAADDDALRQLKAAVDSPARSPADKARDKYRHPVETLSFFGIRPDMTVVEVWPFGGWYTAILAPYLREHGKLYA